MQSLTEDQSSSSPARVVRWLDHLDAMCSRAWCALCAVWFQVQFEPQSG